LVKIIGGYAGLDHGGGGMHSLCGEPACEPHFLDGLLRLDVIAGVGIGREPPHIMRPRDAGWHLTRCRDGRGLDGHFAILRAGSATVGPRRLLASGVTSKLLEV